MQIIHYLCRGDNYPKGVFSSLVGYSPSLVGMFPTDKLSVKLINLLYNLKNIVRNET